MNELLIIVGAIFLLSVLIGVKKGFVKIVTSLIATLLILLLTAVITPYVSNAILENTSLEASMQKKCAEIILPQEGDDSSRDGQIALIEQSELPPMFKELLLENNNNEVYESLGVGTFVDYVGSYIAKLIADIMAFLATFIVVSIIVRVILYIVGAIGELPLVGGINHLAGGAVGIVMGLLIVWILFIVITLLYNTALSQLFFENIEDSKILQILYDSNILMNYVTKFRG